MTDRELMQQALEALEANQPVNYCMNNNGEKFPMMQGDPFRFDRNTKAITALRERLAQPKQEPVAWVDESVIAWLADRKGKTSAHCTIQLSAARSCEQPMPIYTTPPRREWVGLTDEEELMVGVATGLTGIAIRMIEAKLREKNNV